MERPQTIGAGCRRHLGAITSAVALALLATASYAVRLPRAAAPLLLRLEGHLGAAPPGTTREAHLVLQYQGKDYEFDLTKMVVVTGDRSYSQVLQDVTPYRVNFILRGPPESLAPLLNAAPGQKLVVTARYRTGTRDLLIDTMAAAADTTPTPP